MTLFLKLAWRNIFRNKRRTYITGVAIGVGLASLIFVDALILGFEKNMIGTATGSFLGEGQIHGDGFRELLSVETTIEHLDEITSRLGDENIVEHFTVRTMSFGMISSPANLAAVSMVGVEPATEQFLSQIDDVLIEGSYFDGDNERDLIIGSKLADLLEVGLGDRVVLTTAEAHTGDLAQEMFRVSGIYYFNVPEMDGAMAFVRLGKAQAMLGLEDQAHEIALIFTDPRYGRDKNHPFWEEYSVGGNEAVGWPVILPQVEAYFEISWFSTLFTGVIIFGIVVLGIINTLFMSLHERMFEFGVIRAVGTRPTAIARLIVFEAGSLAIVSIVMGIIIALLITWLVTKTGIDYSGIEFGGVTIRERLYPIMKSHQFVLYPILVFVFTTFIGIFPAIRAARMSPAEAMRKSF
ncbi:MAG: ABC transporter permease [Candidatus Latescibacterota bacterium]|nr:MAG: ABC transporter permease [Candidatus Latescibacterota bacterium]